MPKPAQTDNQPVVIAYTGDGKGKTSAALGLAFRALGAGMRVGFVQFIKHWEVSEHKILRDLEASQKYQLTFVKGGLGFYNAGDMSAKDTSELDHKQAALKTLATAQDFAASGEFDLVICDEINNAASDGLIEPGQIEQLIHSARHNSTSLCLTGRNFPERLLDQIDIATEMRKIRHHYDTGTLASLGIDF